MPEIEIEIWCSCGAGLCNQSKAVSKGRGGAGIEVQPCESCLEKAKSEGYDTGFDEGYDKGSEEATNDEG